MSEYRHILVSLLKRAVVAAPFFALGFFILFRGADSLAAGDVIGVCGCAAIILGAIILAFPLARLAAESSGNLYYPGKRFSRPQPLYSIAQSKRAKGLYEEAILGYDKIARDYPDELKPYVEMIDIAVVNLRNEERARSIFYKGLTELKKDDDKKTLARIYEATITRLQLKPEWLEEQQRRVFTAPDLKDQGPVEEPDGKVRRRFHAGGDARASEFIHDVQTKIPYRKRKSAEPSSPPDSE